MNYFIINSLNAFFSFVSGAHCSTHFVGSNLIQFICCNNKVAAKMYIHHWPLTILLCSLFICGLCVNSYAFFYIRINGLCINKYMYMCIHYTYIHILHILYSYGSICKLQSINGSYSWYMHFAYQFEIKIIDF